MDGQVEGRNVPSSLLFNIPHRRLVSCLHIAIPNAFFMPTRITSRLPLVSESDIGAGVATEFILSVVVGGLVGGWTRILV